MLASRHVCIRRFGRAVGRLIVIAGAGDVGGRLARALAARGDEVLALRRREAAIEGVRTLRADVAGGQGLDRLPRGAEGLVFCAAPDRREEAAYRRLYVDGLRRLLDACDPARAVFTSSTAVYGEDAGEWVDEATPPRPAAFNGRVLREAEQVVETLPGRGTVLRASGLYGPGRDLMWRKARSGEPGRAHWTNRLHVDDAASALMHLLDLPAPAAAYIGTDDRPAREDDVLAHLRARLGLPPGAAAPGPETGRRLCNARLRASGWAPRFPDFRAGYADPPADPAGGTPSPPPSGA